MRKLICNIEDSGAVEVKFEGAHLNKRELLRLLKAIRLEYRRRIRSYRSELMANQSRQKREAEENAERIDERSKEIDEELAAETSKADVKNVGVKEDGITETKDEGRQGSREQRREESAVERNARAVRAHAAAVGGGDQS